MQCSKACMHIGIGPFVKPGELIISYHAILFSTRAFHFCNIKTRGGGSRNGFHEYECIRKFWEGDVVLELHRDISMLHLFRFVIHLPL